MNAITIYKNTDSENHCVKAQKGISSLCECSQNFFVLIFSNIENIFTNFLKIRIDGFLFSKPLLLPYSFPKNLILFYFSTRNHLNLILYINLYIVHTFIPHSSSNIFCIFRVSSVRVLSVYEYFKITKLAQNHYKCVHVLV